MKMKLTESKDGKYRQTFRVEVRLTRSEIEIIEERMIKYDGSRGYKAVRNFLKMTLRGVVEDEVNDYYGLGEDEGESA